MNIVKHFDRVSILNVIRSSGRPPRHLSVCRDCKLLYDLLREYQVAGGAPLVEAPSSWIRKAKTIPLTQKLSSSLEKIVAILSFDSWTTPLAVTVRGRGTVSERRLRFETERVFVDLRAERQKRGWDFVAQVTGKQSEPATIQLQHGRTLVPSSDAGFFQWTCAKTTAPIRIQVDSALIELPEISWKGPQKK